MDSRYCQLIISATDKSEADRISDSLLKKRLIAGALIIKGPSRYWWKGEIVEREYYNIQAFSLIKNKEAIIAAVKEIHSDECPIVAFVPLDGNKEFLDWIAASVA